MLWMAVSPDRFEIPLAVEETAKGLAISMGTTETNIRSKKSRQHNGKNCGYKVVTVRKR